MSDARATLQGMFDEIINEGRLEVADELFADDYVDQGPMGDLTGREAFKQLVAQWREAVPDVHCEIDHVIVDGDLAAWLVRTTGTHTGNGLGFPATNRRFETVSANLGRFATAGATAEAYEHPFARPAQRCSSPAMSSFRDTRRPPTECDTRLPGLVERYRPRSFTEESSAGNSGDSHAPGLSRHGDDRLRAVWVAS